MRLLPERRQHLRIVTLKNAAWLLIGSIVFFIAFSAWNELRPRDPSRERLSQRGSDRTPPAAAPEPPRAIEERPVANETFAVRGGADSLAPPPPSPPPFPAAVETVERPRRMTLKEARQRGVRVVVTGGTEGVRVESTPATPDRF